MVSQYDDNPYGGYQARPLAPSMPTPAPSYTPQPAAQPTMGNYFSDPLLQQYVNMSRNAMSSLMRPTQAPQSNAALNSAIAALQGLLNAPDEGFNYFRPIAERRMAELDQPGYTHSQLDQIRTQLTDPLTAQRDAARQNLIQRFASKGLTPDSGIVQQALLDLDRTYAQQTTTGETQLALNAANQDEARRQERVAVGAQAAGLAGRNQGTKVSAAGQLAGLGQNQQQLDLQRQQLDVQNLLHAMGLSQNLSQLPIQLQAQQIGALNALQGPVPQYTDPTVAMLMQLMGMGEGVFNNSMNSGSSFWSQLGGLVQGLAPLFGKPKPSGSGGGIYSGGVYQGE